MHARTHTRTRSLSHSHSLALTHAHAHIHRWDAQTDTRAAHQRGRPRGARTALRAQHSRTGAVCTLEHVSPQDMEAIIIKKRKEVRKRVASPCNVLQRRTRRCNIAHHVAPCMTKWHEPRPLQRNTPYGCNSCPTVLHPLARTGGLCCVALRFRRSAASALAVAPFFCALRAWALGRAVRARARTAASVCRSSCARMRASLS